MRTLLLLTLSLGCFPISAFAADCPVEKFTFQDFQRLKFSKALAMSVLDTMDSSHQENQNKDFGLEALVKGVPIKVNYKDAKAVSDYLKSNYNLTFSQNEEIDYLRTNVSLVGASMYSDCLKRRTEQFDIQIPNNAYTDDQFIVTIKWTPKAAVPRTQAPARLTVLNGTVNKAEQQVSINKLVTFVVRRAAKNKSLSIVPTVDGLGNGEDPAIVLPPIIDPAFKTVLRKWPEPNQKPFASRCSDDGGGNCGDSRKYGVECMAASPSGILLASTVGVQLHLNGGGYAEVTKDSGASKVCVEWAIPGRYNGAREGTGGFGQRGYASIADLTFFAYEVVPDK